MNASLDYLRKRKRRPEFRMSDLSEQQVLVADARMGTAYERDQKEKGRVREFMGELLGKVSEEDRILLTLKEVEGLSLKELESVYDVNENALKVRLFRARQRVLKAFAALGDSDPRGKEAV
jgi:RNA polymerase sigma-70 factor (ECF subfamily)